MRRLCFLSGRAKCYQMPTTMPANANTNANNYASQCQHKCQHKCQQLPHTNRRQSTAIDGNRRQSTAIDGNRRQSTATAPYQLIRHKNNKEYVLSSIVLYCPQYCPLALPSLPAHINLSSAVLATIRFPYASERHPRSVLISVLALITRKYAQQDVSLVSTLFNATPTPCQSTPITRQRLRTRLFQAYFYAYNLYL